MNEVRLKDDNGVEVGPGEPGELFARSPMLLAGYLDDEEATRAGYDADGFFSVGDIAVRDDAGFISIVDRKKDMIIAGGVNIFPREIEEVVARHAAVDDVAVVGVPDEVYGERIAAYVVARSAAGIDLPALETLRPRARGPLQGAPRVARGRGAAAQPEREDPQAGDPRRVRRPAG